MSTHTEASAERPQPSKERQGFLPTLSLAERDRRWRAVRDMMAYQGFDCLVLIGNDLQLNTAMANFRYLTHIGTRMGGGCLFPLEGEPIVYTGLPHVNRPFSIYLHTQDWVSDIRPGAGGTAVLNIIEEVKRRGYERSRIGLVGAGTAFWSGNVNYIDYSRLREGLPQAEIVEMTGAINHIRVIKSDEEIEMLRRSGELARKMVMAMRESVQVGKRECEVWIDMLRASVADGGEPVPFILLTSGPTEGVTDRMEHLLHGADQPGSPSMRPLQKGDLVITELHACWGGYLAAAEYSVFLGKAPDPLRRIHDVALECFYSGIERMRPGTTAWELAEAFRAPCIKAGLDWVELGFHGHGLTSPEIPSIVYKADQPQLSGRGFRDMVLKENMVFGTNIDIFDPNWRADVGIMLGDMLQVTKGEPRLLCNLPMEFPQNAG